MSKTDSVCIDRNQNEIELFFTDTGSGNSTLVMLHGWGCDSHDWSWQLPAFESRFRVVAVDLRGHGRSQTPQEGYEPSDFVTDIECLIDRLDLPKPLSVMGHSMGGQIAARLACKRPELVSSLVLVDPTLAFDEDAVIAFERIWAPLFTENTRDIGPALIARLYTEDSDEAIVRWHARRLQGTPQHVLRQTLKHVFFGPKQVAIGSPSELLCRQIRCPVYSLHSDPARAARIRTWLSHSHSEVYSMPGAGHWFHIDHSHNVNDLILAWLAKI